MDDYNIQINEDGTKSCKMCRGCSHSDEDYIVITPSNIKVQVPFNYCPVCGRELDYCAVMGSD